MRLGDGWTQDIKKHRSWRAGIFCLIFQVCRYVMVFVTSKTNEVSPLNWYAILEAYCITFQDAVVCMREKFWKCNTQFYYFWRNYNKSTKICKQIVNRARPARIIKLNETTFFNLIWKIELKLKFPVFSYTTLMMTNYSPTYKNKHPAVGSAFPDVYIYFKNSPKRKTYY